MVTESESVVEVFLLVVRGADVALIHMSAKINIVEVMWRQAGREAGKSTTSDNSTPRGGAGDRFWWRSLHVLRRGARMLPDATSLT